MDLAKVDLGAVAREHLARRGIDPDAVALRPPPTVADHLAACAEEALEMVLPPMFQSATADHPAVIRWVTRYLHDATTAPNLLILGAVGTGKTHQAIGALRDIVLESARRCRPLDWKVTTHPEFNAAMRPRNDNGHVTELADLQRVSLLVFDDLGAGKSTDWTDDTLHRLIDARWSHQLSTIVTTNLDAEEMRGGIDERVVSRLLRSDHVSLDGYDRRAAQ